MSEHSFISTKPLSTPVPKPLWTPTQTQIQSTALFRFTQTAQTLDSSQGPFATYKDLWHWSIEQKDLFWNLVWDFCGVIGDKGARVFQDAEHLTQTRWFPEAKLNYAENLLAQARAEPEQPALVFWGEDRVQQRVSNQQLLDAVRRCQQALSRAGVGTGDRVAGYLPNSPYAIIAMLATASLGAVWSSASPDFGIEGVLDRFGQIDAKVLFCTDGYYYNGKWQDCHPKNQAILQGLSSVSHLVICDYHDAAHELAQPLDRSPVNNVHDYENELKRDTNAQSQTHSWRDFMQLGTSTDSLHFERVAFNDPLFILFSSGTTGVPKCIVHGVGGTLLQHLKEHQLHSDVRAGDRLFYFSTCGWMMWNWLASGLASGATLLLYDGSPFAGNQTLLFDFADAEQMTHFGTSAKYIEACHKANLNPRESHGLAALRAVFSTGSPLAPAGFEYVYSHIKDDVVLSSISGGTDILSCFALGNPTLPVYIGQLQCLGLGMAVNVFDEQGQPLATGKGDLVCTESFPSMPIGFWQDANSEKYHQAYFNTFANVWCHGDYVEFTPQGGMVIHGRSDAVLNPGGVRIGTAEIYRQVETINEVLESVVIGQRWEDDVRVVLFVVLRAGAQLNEALIGTIKQTIRAKTTPRHVPSKIVQVADIPRTKSGKIVELAVRNVVHGEPVKNLNSLANPEALDYFKDLAELQH